MARAITQILGHEPIDQFITRLIELCFAQRNIAVDQGIQLLLGLLVIQVELHPLPTRIVVLIENLPRRTVRRLPVNKLGDQLCPLEDRHPWRAPLHDDVILADLVGRFIQCSRLLQGKIPGLGAEVEPQLFGAIKHSRPEAGCTARQGLGGRKRFGPDIRRGYLGGRSFDSFSQP